MAQVNHREQLVEGAMACIQTKGFARTTARDIARAAGANLASIGYHFGSKDALLEEALVRIFEQRNRHLGKVGLGEDVAVPLDRLTGLFVAVRKLFQRHRPVLVAFVEAMAEAEHSPELRKRMATHYRHARAGLGDLLRRSLGADADRFEGDPEVLASLIMAAFDGLVLQSILEPAAVPHGDELVNTLVEWVVLAAEQG